MTTRYPLVLNGTTVQELQTGDSIIGLTSSTALVKGDGSTGLTAATAGTDYVIPSGNITGTASNVTGIVAIANGGTGQTTQQAALNALAGAVTSAQFLRGNGTNVAMSAIQASDEIGRAHV